MKKSLLLITLLASMSANAEPVKKSKSSICHAPGTEFYERTTNFTAFGSLEECIASGGRMPKGQSIQEPTKTPVQPLQKTASASKYSRDQFGKGWADEDKDCQSTRQEILISMSTNPVRFADERKCRVTFGRWISMYSGEVVFDASKLEIDHVVPLKWAWEHGADQWPKSKRIQFANDPINLVPAESSLNSQKGAKGLDEWLPPTNQEQYKARFNRVLIKYNFGSFD